MNMNCFYSLLSGGTKQRKAKQNHGKAGLPVLVSPPVMVDGQAALPSGSVFLEPASPALPCVMLKEASWRVFYSALPCPVLWPGVPVHARPPSLCLCTKQNGPQGELRTQREEFSPPSSPLSQDWPTASFLTMAPQPSVLELLANCLLSHVP